MILEINVPSPGESVTEVEIGHWLAEDGSVVKAGQEIAEVESDKATLTVVAGAAGKLKILVKEGQPVAVNAVIATIDTEVTGIPAVPPEEINPEVPPGKPEPVPIPEKQAEKELSSGQKPEGPPLKITAVAREMMKEHHISVDDLIAGLKRIGKKEVEAVVRLAGTESERQEENPVLSREVVRERMTVLRRKLSERLVAVKNETAMLTTFNEVDMSNVMEIRKIYQKQFTDKHGVKLGFMAFFTKAAAIALQVHPSVNSMIDGEEIVTPVFADIGIAVQTPKGLMVPVVRNAESKTLLQIETEIKELAEKARNKKISIDELSGGTFTITNGGVFGSLLSTPIINPPQSAILGMHNIAERPVAINGKVEIRPMMYIALSYDHRVIDGKDSVGFLVKVKEMIENPGRMISGGKDPIELLLGI